MKKSKKPLERENALFLTDLPSVGKKTAEYLRMAGVRTPAELEQDDPYDIYVRLCTKTERRFDPCLLDQFISAWSFLKGLGNFPWWNFTEERKSNFRFIEEKIRDFEKFPSSRKGKKNKK